MLMLLEEFPEFTETLTDGDTLPLIVLLTARSTTPGVAKFALSTGLLKVFESTTVVESSVPFQSTLLPLSKFAPNTVSVAPLAPASRGAGATC